MSLSSHTAIAESNEIPIRAEIPICAEIVSDAPETELQPSVRRGWIRWGWELFTGCIEWLFGLMCMVIGLSILATIPLVQVLSLGYLLDLSAQVAQTGKLRSAFSHVRSWARFGGAIMAGWLLLQPLRLLADLRYSAMLLDNDVAAARIGIAYLIAFAFILTHLAWSIYRGGRIRHFAWPAPIRFVRQLRAGGTFVDLRDRFFDWVGSFDVRHLAMQGLRGIVVATGWLFVPITMMVIASRLPEGGALALSLIAAACLSFVLIYLPFLQINAATAKSIRSGFDVAKVREQFRRAPIAYWFALLLTLLLALPLYILKAELIPREAAWLPSIVFVISILPARILAGWAVNRGSKYDKNRHWFFRHGARLFSIPVVLIYVFIVYLTQYVSWYGPLSLYEQHAFLLPVPFIGL